MDGKLPAYYGLPADVRFCKRCVMSNQRPASAVEFRHTIESRKKTLAIFKHQSQKDVAPFPGPDPREFWQRVEDRNRGTAELLRSLGLPAYYAMEAYVVLEGGQRLPAMKVPTATLGEGV